MKNIITLVVSTLFFVSVAQAQKETIKLYRGTLDKMKITLYLIETEDGCPTTSYNGMYKYNKVSKWLQLDISDNEADKLVMVEIGITGILSLKRKGEILSGYWISPDGNKKYKVLLKEATMDGTSEDEYQIIFDELNYQNHDC